jgi:probable HAF family extracellular repeat protein
MNVRTCYLATAVLVTLQFSPAAKAQNYTFQIVGCGIDTPDPFGINNQGTVVGAADQFDAQYAQGFVYSNGTCKTTSLVGAGTSFLGITDTNEIIGLYTQSEDYVLKNGSIKALLPPYAGASGTYYCCLNTSTGVVAANYTLTGSSERYGFLYEKGKFTPLPNTDSFHAPSIYGMNKQGIVAGTMNSFVQTGFVYIAGKMSFFEYPGAKSTTFNGINDNDLIVGTFYIETTGAIGIFTYSLDTAVWTNLNFPTEYNAVLPVGITNSGVIATEYTPAGGLLIATPAN